MEICSENNVVELIGTLAGRPLYSHSSRGLDFDTFPLEIRRLSGTPDRNAGHARLSAGMFLTIIIFRKKNKTPAAYLEKLNH